MVTAASLAVIGGVGALPLLISARILLRRAEGRLMAGVVILELLAVVAITAHAATNMHHHHHDHASVVSALANLEAALEEYARDHGGYPPSDEAFSSRPLVIYLDGDPSNGGPDETYVELKPEQLDASGEIIDHWKRPLRYRENRQRLQAAGVTAAPEVLRNAEGAVRPLASQAIDWRRFDLWSTGPNAEDPIDDIGSWREREQGSKGKK